ncbi:iron complex outermembrane receptor protein [Brevundimonas alba]|uniref:Iron complex outermembrane receptor protein n=1 Tax=Brevundimonas alba TaxID=74314 RepID=A0A7X6BMI4_9CAUL|nr:TonB-dependent receptor [Brevundimonas alba]NJC41093.1 iron complex outermembrane receptor protein [Brevundimonas alba]
MNRKRVFWATTALFTGLLAAGAASAQSSGTVATEATEVDTVVITGVRGPREVGGAVAQNVDKTRSTIGQELIARQNPGQTILQTLNLVPGLNFTNSDPYGNSGGNIRLRGFDGNRVGLAFDGVPLNDTGNYATFTNQQLDPELIERASVSQGTTDVDSPTAAALGGIINYTSARPYDEAGLTVNGSAGEFNYLRGFVRADTGAFGPWGTTAYATYSYTNYDKFKGPGELEKKQVNGRIYQDLGDGDFASLSGHWNVNRNAFYNNFINLAQFESGNYLENDIACIRPLAVNGTVQNENTQAVRVQSDGSLANGSCTNYAGLRINPSNTGNIRGQFSYGLTDNLRFTFDPSYQFTMANGGGFTVVSERDDRLDLGGATGVDLNGDTDTLDSVTLYTPSNTNTNRYGVLSSLIWDLNDDHRLRASYTLDYGIHRQTGEAVRTDRFANPIDVFGGSKNWGSPEDRVFAFNNNSWFRTRDRRSVAILNQLTLDYRGQFFNDALTISIGARAPMFKRELDQFCYTQNGTNTVLCTAQTPVGFTTTTNPGTGVVTTTPNAGMTTGANGNVAFIGNTNQYVAPYQSEFKYDDILPNIAIGYDFGDSSVYASYSEQIAVPRTDNLYTAYRVPNATTVQPIALNDVDPEFTKNYEVGYRYTTSSVVASVAAYMNQYSNRVVSTLDNDPTSETFNTTIDRNIGEVETRGVEGSIGWQVLESFSLYGAFTYTDSELQEDQIVGQFTCPAVSPVPPANGAGCVPGERSPLLIPTKGKQVVETPEWQVSLRADWQVTDAFSVGLQGKWVDERFTTDVNDEVVPSYTVVDFDARYDLTDTFGIKDAFVQLNVSNLFDEQYPINISSGQHALNLADVNPGPGVNPRTGSPRTFGVAAPRTAVITIGTRF